METAHLLLIVGYFSTIFAIVLGFLYYRSRAAAKPAEPVRAAGARQNAQAAAVSCACFHPARWRLFLLVMFTPYLLRMLCWCFFCVLSVVGDDSLPHLLAEEVSLA